MLEEPLRRRRQGSSWLRCFDGRLPIVGSFRIRRCLVFERCKKAPALVRDDPRTGFTYNELLAKQIEVRGKRGKPLHSRHPIGAAGIEDREVLFDHLEGAAPVGLTGQDLQY